MANVGAFVQVMDQFLDEITSTFPEETALAKYKATFDLLRKANPRKIMEGFMASAEPFSEKIMAMDETFFLNNDIEFLNALNIKKWWTPELSPNTKQSIWQFLQYLLITGGANVTPQIPKMNTDIQSQIIDLAKSVPKPDDGKEFDVDSIPTDAILNIARQFDPNSELSEDHVKQAMGMVKGMMQSQQDEGLSQEEVIMNMMKSFGGNFSK